MTDNKLIDKIYSQPRKTIFDGVYTILDNKKYTNIFGSNIDTIFFCDVLKLLRTSCFSMVINCTHSLPTNKCRPELG